MTIAVTLVWSPAARQVVEQTLALAPGTTARSAILESDIPMRFPGLDWMAMTPGIWGKACAWERLLVDGDRLELCRPLLADPKVSRRERFRKQGARGTGLFAHRRDGGKAGY